MHKKQRRQERDGLIMMARRCSDIAPLSGYTNKPYVVAEVLRTYRSLFSMVVDIEYSV